MSVRLEQRRCGDQHARRAEATLHTTALEEGPLEWCQVRAVGKPFDRRHFASLSLEREVRARVHRPAIEEHHAGAALRIVAALLRASEADRISHRDKECRRRLQLELVAHAVDLEGRRNLHGAPLAAAKRASLAGTETSPPSARRTAASITRRATTSALARRQSGEPRTSEIGLAACAAALAAAAAAAIPPSEPSSASSASGTSMIVGAKAVMATRARV